MTEVQTFSSNFRLNMPGIIDSPWRSPRGQSSKISWSLETSRDTFPTSDLGGTTTTPDLARKSLSWKWAKESPMSLLNKSLTGFQRCLKISPLPCQKTSNSLPTLNLGCWTLFTLMHSLKDSTVGQVCSLFLNFYLLIFDLFVSYILTSRVNTKSVTLRDTLRNWMIFSPKAVLKRPKCVLSKSRDSVLRL